MTIWIKPNDKEININDNKATVKYAESLGWVRKDQEDDLEALRAEHEKVLGKKPHHKLGEIKIKKAIAEAKKAEK